MPFFKASSCQIHYDTWSRKESSRNRPSMIALFLLLLVSSCFDSFFLFVESSSTSVGRPERNEDGCGIESNANNNHSLSDRRPTTQYSSSLRASKSITAVRSENRPGIDVSFGKLYSPGKDGGINGNIYGEGLSDRLHWLRRSAQNNEIYPAFERLLDEIEKHSVQLMDTQQSLFDVLASKGRFWIALSGSVIILLWVSSTSPFLMAGSFASPALSVSAASTSYIPTTLQTLLSSFFTSQQFTMISSAVISLLPWFWIRGILPQNSSLRDQLASWTINWMALCQLLLVGHGSIRRYVEIKILPSLWPTLQKMLLSEGWRRFWKYVGQQWKQVLESSELFLTKTASSESDDFKLPSIIPDFMQAPVEYLESALRKGIKSLVRSTFQKRVQQQIGGLVIGIVQGWLILAKDLVLTSDWDESEENLPNEEEIVI